MKLTCIDLTTNRTTFSRHFILRIAAVLLLAVLASAVPAQKIPNRPPAKADNTQKSIVDAVTLPSVGLTVEKFSSSYYLNSDGTGVQTVEMRQRCTTDECLQQIKKFKREFNGDLTQTRVIEAYLVKKDGTKTVVPSSAIVDRKSAQAEAAPGFSSLREAEIAFDGVAVGDLAVVRIELKTIKPVYGSHFSGLESFPLIFDWNDVNVSISAPSDDPIYVDVSGLQGGKTGEANGRMNWQWTAKDLKSIPMEPFMTDVVGPSPRLVFSTIKDYAELAAAFRQGVLQKAEVTPEVKTLAEEITQGITDPAQQASAIYTWVNKNIRYLQVYVDRDGWIPHSTSQILSTRYGDCKDYTTLLYALLKAKGIESAPSLVRADGGDWFPSVPSLYYFNHAILFVPSLNMIADATVPNTRMGMISQALVGKKVLVADVKPHFYDVPKDDPNTDVSESEIDVTVSEDGSLKAVSKEKHTGRREAISRALLGSPNAKDPDFAKMIFTFSGIEASGRIVKTSDPAKIDEPFAMDIESEMASFMKIQRRGSFTLPVGINLQNMLAGEAFLKPENRKTKLMLGAQRVREVYRFHLPQTMSVTTLPAAVKIENSVGKYTVEFERTEDGVRVTRELVAMRDMVGPQEYPLAKELYAKAAESQKTGIEYTSTVSTAAKSGKEKKKIGVSNDSTDLYSKLKASLDETPLTAKEVKQLEAFLQTKPDDFQARAKLARYYSNLDEDDTPARVAKRIAHRLWFVRTHPEIGDRVIFGWVRPYIAADSNEYRTLRAEWLKQVAANKTNAAVRLNAIEFLADDEHELAAELLREGEALDKENYKFPLGLALRLNEDLDTKKASPDEQKRTRQNIVAEGEKAISLIKRERSSERDTDRFELLKVLSTVATDLNEMQKARAFAQELILDFGPSATVAGRASAVHIGNITLGRAELAAGNVEKAKEYLLVSMRAALRLSSDDIDDVDTKLAADLFARGEKQAVSEYLKLWLERQRFKSYPDAYKEVSVVINGWIAAIEKGENPGFDLRAAVKAVGK